MLCDFDINNENFLLSDITEEQIMDGKQGSQPSRSIVVPNSDDARITKLASNGDMIKFAFEDVKTQVDALERGCKLSDNGRCLGWRNGDSEYFWLSYQELINRAKHFGSGLSHLGIQLGQSCNVGIYSKNCVEWVVAQYGCFYNSSPIIPLYDNLGSDTCAYMINNGEIKVIVCDKEKKVETILSKRMETPCLEHIICIDPISEGLQKLSFKKGVKLHQFEDIVKKGKTKPLQCRLPRPTDVVEICYTSGTTGYPKGVILTHENNISATCALLLEMGPIAPNRTDILISYLPLAHVLEQTVQLSVFLTGGCVGFFRGDVLMLMDDMKMLKPTYFPAVPRILNKLYDIAQAKVVSVQIEDCYDINKEKKEERSSFQYWDLKQYKSFKESLGNNIRLVFTAAAPVSETILSFFLQVFECNIVEAYGQTETAGPSTLNIVSQKSVGNVGPPLVCNMVKLEDVPELGYYKKNGSGEMCVKGFNVTKGYYKDPQKTSEVIDKDGWMHTGDIAMWQPDGSLKIIDRVKNIFKLAQGEYVAPEKLQNVYLRSPYISQIFIHGESLQSYLVAIVIPDKDVVLPWCKENIRVSSWEDTCKHPMVKQLILDDMKRIAEAAGLHRIEQVKKIHIYPKFLTLEDGHLTATLKTKRELCRTFFEREIRDMYDENDN